YPHSRRQRDCRRCLEHSVVPVAGANAVFTGASSGSAFHECRTTPYRHVARWRQHCLYRQSATVPSEVVGEGSAANFWDGFGKRCDYPFLLSGWALGGLL